MEKNGILSVTKSVCEKTLIRLETWSPKFWWVFFANRSSFSTQSVESNCALAEEAVRAPSEAVTIQNTANFPQDTPATLPSLLLNLTRLKCQLEWGTRYNLWEAALHFERAPWVFYPKQIKAGEHVWEWILRMWIWQKEYRVGSGRIYWYGFTKQIFLSNVASQGVGKGSNSLVVCLTDTWTKRWPTVS